MYIDYFQLREPPFSLTPDPRYLFMSDRHREGLAHLLYGVQQPGGFVQLTGEIGSGKTTLCRCLIKQLPTDTEVALILNPRLTAIELLATVCDELRIEYPAETGSIKVLIDALNRHLLEAHAQRRRTVLIIDEAQNLNEDVLEQVRLLTNLETSQEKLLQIILIGQPELLSILSGPKLRQLAQRITARYHLGALSRIETSAYVQHRLRVAGRGEPLFTKTALRCVYRLSGGMPRIINIICDRALLGAYSRDQKKIGSAIVRRASRETRGSVRRHRRSRLAWSFAIGFLALATIGIAILFSPSNQSMIPEDRSAVASNTESSPDRMEADPLPSMRIEPGGNLPSKSGIIDILADPILRSDTSSAFASLYELWGVKIPTDSSKLGCQSGIAQGLECLYDEGNWLKLRRLNLPAILETIIPSGERQAVALIGLDKNSALIAIGGEQYTFPLTEIDKVWDGSFVVLWKPPFNPRVLSLGSMGEDVKWIRAALDFFEGQKAPAVVADVYDESLRQRVIAFQRAQSLVPDGYVGQETLTRLAVVLEDSKAPSLERKLP
jgi:general secretion pathway protein A